MKVITILSLSLLLNISFVIAEDASLSISGAVTNISCNALNGSPDGAISVAVTGGVAPYRYNWTGPGLNQTSQDLIGLGAGTYTLVVTGRRLYALRSNILDNLETSSTADVSTLINAIYPNPTHEKYQFL